MLPLCEALGISVNELLSGEELNSTYAEKAEENLIGLIEKEEKHKLSSKKLAVWQTVSLLLSIGVWLFLFADSNVYQLGRMPTPLTLCYLAVGFIAIYATVLTCCYAVIRKNGALISATLLFASLACLLVCLRYETAWLIVPTVTGMVACFVLSVWSLFKNKR